MKNSKGRKAAYTAVLLLCVAAVGVSGYVFVTTAVRNARRQPAALPQPDAPAAQVGRMEPQLTPEAPKEQPDPMTTAVRPVDGEVLQPYSATQLQYDATNRDWRLHSAVDVGAEGQTVRAVMDGTVTSVTEDQLLGVCVTVQHGDGYESRYCSLAQEPAAAVGAQVKAGDALGTVGSTALGESAMEPHLHFELRKDGEPVDPSVLWLQET